MHVLIWGELILWHFNFSEFSLGLLPENKNIFIDSREFQIDDYVFQSALNFGNLKVQDNYHVIYQILIRYLQNPLEKYHRFETPFLTTQIKEDGQLSFLSGQILGIKVPQI